MKFIFNHF